MASSLEELLDKMVSVITNDGRNIVGLLKGYDQATNVILGGCHERVFSPDAGVEQVALGLYIVRGDNIAVVGELDEDADATRDLAQARAEPLKPVVH
mmetsp:Transcript_1349/g.2086  ORF Transcript_1349/g.2086 Transcript_1349/m.2086 type:complete len:97 (-) Transcript_1349:67-357(-)